MLRRSMCALIFLEIHRYEDSTNNVDNSTIESYRNGGLGKQ